MLWCRSPAASAPQCSAYLAWASRSKSSRRPAESASSTPPAAPYYSVTEIGDTSDTSDACDVPHPNNCAGGEDSSVRIDVTVGDGTPDTCSNGTANSIVAIPVRTTTWLMHSSGAHCGLLGEGADGTYDPGPDPVNDDVLVVEFPRSSTYHRHDHDEMGGSGWRRLHDCRCGSSRRVHEDRRLPGP